MILAQSIQWPATLQVLVGICGLLTLVALVFTVALQARKLFGRTPPINDELEKRDKALRKMIFASENNLKERLQETRQRIENLEARYEEMQIDRQRKWEELQRDFQEVRETLAFIRGKFEQEAKA
jgi:TolA-binding protein